MTVKELIERLEKYDGDTQVMCVQDSMDYSPSDLEEKDHLDYDTTTGEFMWTHCVYIF